MNARLPGALELDRGGDWLLGVERLPSPNADERPAGAVPELVVVHGISLPPGTFGSGCVQRLFRNELDWDEHPYFQEIKGSRVSAHVLIERDGTLQQFVSFRRRAWHAGSSCFAGRERCNDFSIGIELEGSDDTPYEAVQYRRLAALVATLARRWPAIGPQRVVGHCHVSPGRKTDPGPCFDWSHLGRLLGAPPGWAPPAGDP